MNYSNVVYLSFSSHSPCAATLIVLATPLHQTSASPCAPSHHIYASSCPLPASHLFFCSWSPCATSLLLLLVSLRRISYLCDTLTPHHFFFLRPPLATSHYSSFSSLFLTPFLRHLSCPVNCKLLNLHGCNLNEAKIDLGRKEKSLPTIIHHMKKLLNPLGKRGKASTIMAGKSVEASDSSSIGGKDEEETVLSSVCINKFSYLK